MVPVLVVVLRGTVARAAAQLQQQVVPLLVVPVDVAVQLLNLNKSTVASKLHTFFRNSSELISAISRISNYIV